MLSATFVFFQAEPDAEHRLLADRGENEAYLSHVANQAYAVYFPDGGSVSLDLREAGGEFTLRWLDISASAWSTPGEISGGDWLQLEVPGADHWVAVLQVKRE